MITKDKEDVKSHIEQNHNGDVTKYMYGAPREYQCDKCLVVFRNESTLKIHICGLTLPSFSEDSEHQCPNCDNVFTSHLKMLNHYATFHTEEKKFQCSKCDYKTFTQTTL